MTTDTERFDLVEIEARARQLRADMMAAAFRRAFAWLRKPRGVSAPVLGRTA